ncbi:biosynthetic arginine decarboxylase [Meridianimarinicoccus aquatilis]|uniref:Arginine decarboxylase n=1 Tax=Meridianimarinicoccus aquatilis TaxID=2552766 RepID=A0A4R6B3B5_9RHOB|nr:biosynthetic arginine decarboxylase [Fluviibacterium aquatile]QIE41876.1 biosynthetic arginine decarboxylase [Rhodobacteraceae bacterium SC52]TDL89416.1 biosynthetic arginine decarboxylase [Fluviibacterium aquatile]
MTSSLYGIDAWGHGLVNVLPDGNIGLSDPLNREAEPVSLPEIVRDLKDRGIATPIQLRVQSFLDYGLHRLCAAFGETIEQVGYKGVYRGVFPIKVNQQSEVVSRLVEVGQQYGYGLEAGSKPELIVALAQPLAKDSLIICNGVKDDEFIRLAILSRKLGFNTVIVLESLKEFEIVRRVSDEIGVKPMLGVRVKLTQTVTGKWEASSGDRSSFGLGTYEVVQLIDRLTETGFLDCLVLQHNHLGSQVPNVIDVRRTVTEATRFFVELRKMGVPLEYLDLGGGLGIDYTGENNSTDNSVNYSVEEYCTAIVETVGYAMDEAGLPHPTIVTESGRFVTALSSMLIFDVLDATYYDVPDKPAPREGDHHYMSDLVAVEGYLEPRRVQECYNDAVYYRDEIRALFRRGVVDLRQMGRAERAFLYTLARIAQVNREHPSSGDLDAQLEAYVDYYHCNFSLFQSLPDVWAIDQIHPVIPLQRHDEAPTRRAILTDITCDSDGKISHFVLEDGLHKALPVHDLRDDEDYLIGVFFVGAYQETLGDLHNLFGDANVVTIALDGEGGFSVEHETEGDSIAEVLSYVEYDPQDCLAAFRKRVDGAVARRDLSADERRVLISAYKDSLAGYTYFE